MRVNTAISNNDDGPRGSHLIQPIASSQSLSIGVFRDSFSVDESTSCQCKEVEGGLPQSVLIQPLKIFHPSLARHRQNQRRIECKSILRRLSLSHSAIDGKCSLSILQRKTLASAHPCPK